MEPTTGTKSKRPSYGIDAPGLVKGFFIGGAVALALAVGIGGLALAAGLRRKQFDVAVFERDEDPAVTGGYHITLHAAIADYEGRMRLRGAEALSAAMETIRWLKATNTPLGSVITRLTLPAFALWAAAAGWQKGA